LINRSTPCRLADELHHIDAGADDVRIGASEQCNLPIRGLPVIEQGRPQIAHNIEIIRARGGKKGLGAPHRLLHVDIVAQHFGRFDALTERVAPCRLGRCAPNQRVERMPRDAERRCCTLCDEQKWK
jgi:hypothetical protein